MTNKAKIQPPRMMIPDMVMDDVQKILNEKSFKYDRIGIEPSPDQGKINIFVKLPGEEGQHGTIIDIKRVMDKLSNKKAFDYLCNDIAKAIINLKEELDLIRRRDQFYR